MTDWWESDEKRSMERVAGPLARYRIRCTRKGVYQVEMRVNPSQYDPISPGFENFNAAQEWLQEHANHQGKLVGHYDEQGNRLT